MAAVEGFPAVGLLRGLSYGNKGSIQGQCVTKRKITKDVEEEMPGRTTLLGKTGIPHHGLVPYATGLTSPHTTPNKKLSEEVGNSQHFVPI